MMDRRRFGQMLAKLGVDDVGISAADTVFFIIKVTQIADHAAHDIANGKEIGIMGFHGPKDWLCAPAPDTNRVAVIGNHNRFHSVLLSSCYSSISIKQDKYLYSPADKDDKNRIDSLLRPIIYRRLHNFNRRPYQLIITLCFLHAEKAPLPPRRLATRPVMQKRRRLSISTETAAFPFIRLGIGRILSNSFPGRSKEWDGPATAGGLRFDEGERRHLSRHRGASGGRGRRA